MGTDSVDVLLRQYAQCNDAAHAEALLEELVVEHAQPGIRKVVRYKLAFQGRWEAQDVEDVSSDVLVELIARLRAMKDGPAVDSIGSFSGYTAVAAYHACNEYLRRKYPNRHRLKTRLRYLLNTETKFSIWEDAVAEWLCGFSRWQAAQVPPVASDVLGHWRDLLSDLPRGQSAMHPADLLARVFERFGGPVEFDELVSIVAQIWGVDDPPAAPEKSAREVESGDADPGTRMEMQQWLAELWTQIRELPQPQRVALILNLRAGPATPAAALLPLTGIASISEIANTLGYLPEELAKIWNQLPLEDLAIAERLGLTRQQVINLRKSARERLTRRIGGKYRLT
jgi:RNA polymerase sigma factor (sigma-70 family)